MASVTSRAEVVSGGTRWMRLKFTNGSRPRFLHSATTAFTAGLVPPYGASGSRVARSATSSMAQNAPVPRTSPTHSCLRASSARPGRKTSSPSAAACSTTRSSSIVRMVATAAAQASGWPEYVRPPGYTRSSKVAAISGLMATPPSGT